MAHEPVDHRRFRHEPRPNRVGGRQSAPPDIYAALLPIARFLALSGPNAPPLDSSAATQMYAEYRAECQRRNTRFYFEAHQRANSDWLFTHFDSRGVMARTQSGFWTSEAVNQRAESFLSLFSQNQITDDIPSGSLNMVWNEPLQNDKSDCCRSAFIFPASADVNYVMCHDVQPFVTHQHLLRAFEQLPGFRSLLLSFPISRSSTPLLRTAFVEFDSNADAVAAVSALHKQSIECPPANAAEMQPPPPIPRYTLSLALSQRGRHSRVTIMPQQVSSLGSVEGDLRNARALISALDQLRGVTDSILNADLSSLTSDQAQLDLLLFYLRRVHCTCFYCARSFFDQQHMFARCGVSHQRQSDRMTFGVWNTSLRQFSELTAEESSPLSAAVVASWTEWHGNAIQQLIRTPNHELLHYQQHFQKLSDATDALCQSMCQELEPNSKYKCLAPNCGKMFKGQDFVFKHVQKKHEDLVGANLSKLIESFNFDTFVKSADFVVPPLLAAVDSSPHSQHVPHSQPQRSQQPQHHASNAPHQPPFQPQHRRARSRSPIRHPNQNFNNNSNYRGRSRSRSPSRRRSFGNSGPAPFPHQPHHQPMASPPQPQQFNMPYPQQPTSAPPMPLQQIQLPQQLPFPQQQPSHSMPRSAPRPRPQHIGPLVPPPGAKSDPRSLRSYQDVDTATAADVEIDYGSFT